MIKRVIEKGVKILKKLAHAWYEASQMNGYMLWSGYNLKQFQTK